MRNLRQYLYQYACRLVSTPGYLEAVLLRERLGVQPILMAFFAMSLVPVVHDDKIRADSGDRYPEKPHLMVFGETMILTCFPPGQAPKASIPGNRHIGICPCRYCHRPAAWFL